MKKYDGVVAYGKDKRRQVAYSERFAELLGKKGAAICAWRSGNSDGMKSRTHGCLCQGQEVAGRIQRAFC
jgi:hypothetical protein